MAIVPARCTQCGGNIQIDASKEAGICPHCGTAFITEKVINNYNSYVTNQNDYSGATFNYYGDPLLLEKHLQNARRAKTKEDWEEVEKYYNRAEECDPTCIEAVFYSAFAKAKLTLTSSDNYKRISSFNTLSKSVSLIDDYFNIEKKDSEAQIVNQVCKDVLELVNSDFTYNVSGQGIFATTDQQQTKAAFKLLLKSVLESIENIVKKYGENNSEAKYLYEWIVIYCIRLLKYNNYTNEKEEYDNKIKKAVYKIKTFDPYYVMPKYSTNPTPIALSIFMLFIVFLVPVILILIFS